MNYRNDKCINLKHLIFSCLKGWRFVLIFTVIGAAVFCGFFLLKENVIQYSGKNAIIAYQDEINEINSLQAQIKNLNDQKVILETYEKLLEDAVEQKESLSDSEKTGWILKLVEINDKIFLLKTQISEIESSISDCIEEDEFNLFDSEYVRSIDISDEKALENISSLLEERNNQIINNAVQRISDVKEISDYIKYSVIGALLGAIISLIWLAAKFIVRNKVDGEDTVRLRYNVPVLANMHLSDEKPNAWVDRVLKMCNDERLKVDFNEEYKILAAKFQSICSEEVKEILICSSINDSALNRMCEEVNTVIDSRITVKFIGNPAREADAAIAVKNAVVVVAEKLNCSGYRDIDKVAEQLALSKAKVIGFVIV